MLKLRLIRNKQIDYFCVGCLYLKANFNAANTNEILIKFEITNVQSTSKTVSIFE